MPFLASRTGRFRGSAASDALDAHLTQAIAEIAPAPQPQSNGATAMSTTPATAGLNVKQMMEDHTRMMGEIHQAQTELLRAALARQRDTVAQAVTSVASKIDGQTDDFLAIMGQFANDLGGG